MAIEFRAIFLGTLALIACYFVWAIAATSFATVGGTSMPPGAWFLLSLVGAVGPCVAGYIAARLANSRKVLHGIIASIAGAALILLALGALMGGMEVYGFLGVLIAAPALSLVGSLLASRRPAGP
jgi:hypothetical protein